MVGVRTFGTASALALAAAAMTLAVTALYWSLIGSQGTTSDARVHFIAGSWILSAAALGLSAVLPQVPVRLLLLSFASSTLLLWSLLGAFSIGALLWPPLIVALVAAVKISDSAPTASAWIVVSTAAVASVALTAAGLGAT